MWINVTDNFSESQRCYRDTYLEISEVYDNVLEISLFSSEESLYEIYISYREMVGIVYSEADNAYELREEIKTVLENDYKLNNSPSDEFIEQFADKYDIQLPFDLFFDSSSMFDF